MEMKVLVGGTFAYLHKGHRALLRKAFELGEPVYIALTSDSFAKHKGNPTKSFAERKRELKGFAAGFGKRFRIIKIHDKFSFSLRWDLDAIVVSGETYRTAKEINQIRKSKGLKELRIVKVRYVLAEDKLPISSSRIRAGKIDAEGRILRSSKRSLDRKARRRSQMAK